VAEERMSSWASEDTPSPMVELFYCANGGVVSNAATASRLAQLILEPLIGEAKLSANLPLIVEKHGDLWSITGNRKSAGFGDVDPCHLEIRQIDAAVSGLSNPESHDLLADATIAEEFTAAICEETYGEARSQGELPWRAEDKGKTWLVRGSHNKDGAVEGIGPFRILVRKRDARVLDIRFEYFRRTPPEVQALLRAVMKKPDQET